jgi:hypothetical protein
MIRKESTFPGELFDFSPLKDSQLYYRWEDICWEVYCGECDCYEVIHGPDCEDLRARSMRSKYCKNLTDKGYGICRECEKKTGKKTTWHSGAEKLKIIKNYIAELQENPEKFNPSTVWERDMNVSDIDEEDFDTDDKFDLMIGTGFYSGENADFSTYTKQNPRWAPFAKECDKKDGEYYNDQYCHISIIPPSHPLYCRKALCDLEYQGGYEF